MVFTKKFANTNTNGVYKKIAFIKKLQIYIRRHRYPVDIRCKINIFVPSQL